MPLGTLHTVRGIIERRPRHRFFIAVHEGGEWELEAKRYQPHERIALAELLAPHSDVLVRLFGMSAAGIAEELDKILRKLSGGAAMSMFRR